ncbi:MAG: thiol reductant ABC exporter subunit CydC [Bifidobacterium sp.]|uniref:thiol reductant ABC exporter subunit CydC n=1 Tax=Bifidobacterium sp. TaxID=41200 RepID=UPI0039E8D1E2
MTDDGGMLQDDMGVATDREHGGDDAGHQSASSTENPGFHETRFGAHGKRGLGDYLKAWHHDRWFWPYLRQNRWRLALIFLLGTLTFVCAAGLMFTSGYLISRSARHPYNVLMVYVPIVLTRAFGLGRPTFSYAERILSHDWVLHVVSKLRVGLYRTLARDASFLDEHEQTGSVLGVLADDLDHLENFYLRTIFPTIVAFLVWVLVTISLGIFSWQTCVMILIIFALVLVLAPMVSLQFADMHYHREKAARSHEYTKVAEEYLGLGDWIITHRSREFVETGEAEFRTVASSTQSRERFERWRDFLIQLAFAAAAVVLMVASSLVLTSSTTLADYAAAAVLSVFPLIDCFIVVAQAIAEVPLYGESLAHLNGLSARVDGNALPESPQQRLEGGLESIDFDHVTFRYGPDEMVLLDDFSLHIDAGEKVALLGPSGEGKTTILQLLLGDLIPTSGEVRINGIPVRALQEERKRLFGYLNQSPFIFRASIGGNVRLGRPEASDEEVWNALETVELDGLVRDMPQGLDTVVGERGSTLSGGQRERLALARILVKDTPMVLLDEPTIGLDPITERHLMSTIFKANAQRTMLWVTHHLQGLEHADRMIFLEGGHIVMQGDPEELYRSDERFRALYRMDVAEL